MKVQHQKFKLICLDLDGTLLNDQKEVSVFTKSVLKKVYETFEIKVVLASSRMPKSVQNIQKQLGIPVTIIALDGAIQIDEQSNFEVSSREDLDYLSPDVIKTVYLLCDDTNMHFGIYSKELWAVKSLDYWALREIRGTKLWPDQIGSDVEEFPDFTRATKIMLRGDSASIDKVMKQLTYEYSIDLFFHREKETLINLTSSKINKLVSLQRLMNCEGITADEVIAFGDSDNDLEVLEYVGMGIAMHNGNGNIRTIANEVTLSNNEDGVALALLKHFGCQDLFFPALKSNQ